MNHSLATADRNTHLKIAAVALAAAIGVVVVGVTARTSGSDGATARVGTDGIVVKAGRPATYTSRDGVTLR
jgi:hypothetical protein